MGMCDSCIHKGLDHDDGRWAGYNIFLLFLALISSNLSISKDYFIQDHTVANLGKPNE